MRKIFMRPYHISIYKFVILLIQSGIFYLGLLVISALDYYLYKGIIWYIFKPKIIIIGVFCVWMVMGVYWLAFMLVNLFNPLRTHKKSYTKIAKKEQAPIDEDIKVGEPVDI